MRGIQLLDTRPSKSHAVKHAWREVLNEHVADFDESGEHLHPLRILGVDRDRALIVVQHCEVKAVHIRDVAELAARDVAGARPLHLDHVRAEPRQKLRAGWSGLHVREVEYPDPA